MKKADSNSSDRTNADSEQKAEVPTSSQHSAKPNVAGSLSDNAILQRHKKYFDAAKSYLDALPVNEKGQQTINEDGVKGLLQAFGVKTIEPN